MRADRTVGSELPSGRASSRLAVSSVVAVNLVPIFGVVALGWDVDAIISLYWFESIIILAFTALKILVVAETRPGHETNLLRTLPHVLALIVQYLILWTFAGVFIALLLGPDPTAAATDSWRFVVFALVASHGISFGLRFVYGGGYRTVTMDHLYGQLSPRLIALWVTILIGGSVADTLSTPVGALLVLVLLKTALDLFTYLTENAVAEHSAH